MANNNLGGVIEEAIIPQSNRQYRDAAFWEERYSAKNDDENRTREWLGDYSLFASHFRSEVPDKRASILILGCGNSLLGEQLFEDGYPNVTNIDISESVIRQMKSHCQKCSQLRWAVADCRDLKNLADGQFDVVIEKATIEVFFVGESQGALWSVESIGKEAMESVRRMGDEIERVLKPTSGQFFSISFTAPHFRKDLFSAMFGRSSSKFSEMKIVNVHSLGEHFHFYLYHLVNDPSRKSVEIFSYEPPKMTSLPRRASAAVSEDDRQQTEQFLFSISP